MLQSSLTYFHHRCAPNVVWREGRFFLVLKSPNATANKTFEASRLRLRCPSAIFSMAFAATSNSPRLAFQLSQVNLLYFLLV